METEPSENKPMQEQAQTYLRHLGIGGGGRKTHSEILQLRMKVSLKKLQFIDLPKLVLFGIKIQN